MRDGVTGEWRRLHNEELNDLYFSANGGGSDWQGMWQVWREKIKAYRVPFGKPRGKRPLGRPRRGCEDIIKMDPKEVGSESVGWLDLAEDRERWRAVVSAVMNLGVP
jgi:hypothetical protein